MTIKDYTLTPDLQEKILNAQSASCSREEWVKILMAFKAAGGCYEAARAWSQGGDGYDESNFRATWKSIKRSGGITEASLVQMGIDAGIIEKKKFTPKTPTQKKISKFTHATDDHPYLKRKGVKCHNLKLMGDKLVIPMYNEEEQVGYQTIDGEGNKRFNSGCQKKGSYFLIGSSPGVIVVVEGYATGASIHEITGRGVAVAFDAGNLAAVAENLRRLHPKKRILIAADNDAAGKKGAKAACGALIGGIQYCVPNFGKVKEGNDFNDLAQLKGGEDLVKQQIEQGIVSIRELRIRGGGISKEVDRIESEVIFNQIQLYQRTGELVRPVRQNQEDPKLDDALVLCPVNKHWLLDNFNRILNFKKFNKTDEKWNNTNCSPLHAEIYLSRWGEWKVPELRRVIECPTLREDGSLIENNGYDRESCTYLNYKGQPLVGILDNPTLSEAKDALEVLKVPFCNFPFVETQDYSVIISAVLTVIFRGLFQNAPMVGIDSPVMGSGKSLLADVISLIACGRSIATVSQGVDEGEDEKRISSLLMRGINLICLDNTEKPIGGQFLCSLLTSHTVSCRVLGQSKMMDLPANVTVISTGNNQRFVGDMVRRVLLCQLDPQCERPDDREFGVNLKEWVLEHRHTLISAAINLVRGYMAAGRPKQAFKAYGSFEGWSDLIRSAVVWAGMPDPLETRERLEADDPVKTNLATILTLWHEQFQSRYETVANINQHARDNLRAALLEVGASNRDPEKIDTKRVGHWLRKYIKRTEGGLRFESMKDSVSNMMLWRAVKTTNTGGNSRNIIQFSDVKRPETQNGLQVVNRDSGNTGICSYSPRGNSKTEKIYNGPKVIPEIPESRITNCKPIDERSAENHEYKADDTYGWDDI